MSTTRTTCYGHPRKDVTRIWYDDATRNTAVVEFKLITTITVTVCHYYLYLFIFWSLVLTLVATILPGNLRDTLVIRLTLTAVFRLFDFVMLNPLMFTTDH